MVEQMAACSVAWTAGSMDDQWVVPTVGLLVVWAGMMVGMLAVWMAVSMV